MTMTGSAKLAGIIGWPIGQSLSPRIHGSWIAEYGLDAAYVPLAVRPQDFAAVVNGLRLAGFKGVNVTVPHKEAAFALAERHDGAAEFAGAANVLLFYEDGIEARNTDTFGLSASIVESLGAAAVKGNPVAIWGTGGAARAAAAALTQLGASQVRLLGRNLAHANTLVMQLAPKLSAPLVGLGFGDWNDAAKDIVLLVNATSAGMKGAPSVDLPLDALPKNAAVLDVVYNPLRTPLLVRAEALGLRTIDGLGMLLHQAAPSFEAFFDVTPQVSAALRRTMELALADGR